MVFRLDKKTSVLESLEHAEARGAAIIAELVGYGATSDGYDMVAPSGEGAKRCMEIAAAGGHNLLMSGPPGSGKSMLAARLPGLLPELNARQALETTVIHSVSGMLPEGGLIRIRPFRQPHHSASMPALVGGGVNEHKI